MRIGTASWPGDPRRWTSRSRGGAWSRPVSGGRSARSRLSAPALGWGARAAASPRRDRDRDDRRERNRQDREHTHAPSADRPSALLAPCASSLYVHRSRSFRMRAKDTGRGSSPGPLIRLSLVFASVVAMRPLTRCRPASPRASRCSPAWGRAAATAGHRPRSARPGRAGRPSPSWPPRTSGAASPPSWRATARVRSIIVDPEPTRTATSRPLPTPARSRTRTW